MTGAVETIAGEIENAPVAAQAAGGNDDADGPPPEKSSRTRREIFAGSPVTPLGVLGDESFYLDVSGQLRAVKDHTVQRILHVFGGRMWLLQDQFPVFDKDGRHKKGKFDGIKAATAMVAACEECGVWSPTGRVRGSGAWSDDDGQLVFHAGDEVLIDGDWCSPGVYDGKVYPASDPVPRPAIKIRSTVTQELYDFLETWTWRRPDVDPMLVLGLIAAQMMGGALDWRPVGWIAGDAATGKSTLQRLLLHVHGGEGGLLQAADATEAGIRSVVGYSSLPVAIDELEPDPERPQKVKAVIELARRAASGGQIFRGGVDQKGHQSNAQSSFLFSSILVPDMPAQDRSRLILLELDRLSEEAPRLVPDARKWKNWGAQLRRTLFDGWNTWQERLEAWRQALARHGQTGRGADNYATVLAMADMALNEALPDDEYLESWASKLGKVVTDASVEVGSNAEDMLFHLLSQPLDVWRRGQRYTVAEWVAFAAKLPGAPEAIDAALPENANKYLAPFGLRVSGRGNDAMLAIANKPLSQLCGLFEGTQWANGVWAQAAARLPGAVKRNLTLNRVPTRVHYVPLRDIPGFLNFPMDNSKLPPATAENGEEEFY